VKWDCGSRVQRGILKNAVPVPGLYKVGDIVSYCRRARKEESGIQWSVGSRIVGFETDPNHPNRSPASCWVICDGLSVLVATDKIRPCTAAELLAYQFMHGKDIPDNAISETHEQQAYIDEREVRSEPSKRQKTERKSLVVSQTPDLEEMPISDMEVESHSPEVESHSPRNPSSSSTVPAKELRAQPSLPSSSSEKRDHSPSLASQMKRNKVTGKGVEMLEKIAYLFDDGEKDNSERVGFLQVRLAAPKQKKPQLVNHQRQRTEKRT